MTTDEKYDQIERGLLRTCGFYATTIQSSRSHVEDLIHNLQQRGHPIRVLLVEDDQGWFDLLPQLRTPQKDLIITFVLIADEAMMKASSIAFQGVEFSRNIIARDAPHPIFLCGSDEAIAHFYRQAPNLASILGVGITLP